jgi:protein with PEP-CTERM/exosortase system signal
MSNPTLKLLPALMVAIITAWFSHPAWAGAVEPTLTLTEVSNTQLSWAFDAAGGGKSGTITTLTPDVWGPTSISAEGVGLSGFNGFLRWQEPENPAGSENLVDLLIPAFGLGGGWNITVHSDMISTGGGIPDGQTFPGPGFNMVFVDSAATSETTAVPDTGTTASLFGLSLTGLAFLRRKLC